MNLLTLLPIKDWCYLAAIFALATVLAVFAHHERDVQAAKDTAADIKLADAKIVHDQEVTHAAQTQVAAAVAQYAAAVAAPPVPAPRLVCHADAPGSRPVHTDGGAPTGGDAPKPAPAEAAQGFDPAPAVLADGRDAEAQIALLQSYVKTCQDKGLCAKGDPP